MARPASTGHNDYLEEAWELTEISADMKISDVIETLTQMRFRNGLKTVRLDKEARDFLVVALIARHGKA